MRQRKEIRLVFQKQGHKCMCKYFLIKSKSIFMHQLVMENVVTLSHFVALSKLSQTIAFENPFANRRLTFSQGKLCHYYNDNHNNCSVHVFTFSKLSLEIVFFGSNIQCTFLSHHLSNQEEFVLIKCQLFRILFCTCHRLWFHVHGKIQRNSSKNIQLI